eukprot:12903403-Prorocentrum_lima.AAC.1
MRCTDHAADNAKKNTQQWQRAFCQDIAHTASLLITEESTMMLTFAAKALAQATDCSNGKKHGWS